VPCLKACIQGQQVGPPGDAKKSFNMRREGLQRGKHGRRDPPGSYRYHIVNPLATANVLSLLCGLAFWVLAKGETTTEQHQEDPRRPKKNSRKPKRFKLPQCYDMQKKLVSSYQERSTVPSRTIELPCSIVLPYFPFQVHRRKYSSYRVAVGSTTCSNSSHEIAPQLRIKASQLLPNSAQLGERARTQVP